MHKIIVFIVNIIVLSINKVVLKTSIVVIKKNKKMRLSRQIGYVKSEEKIEEKIESNPIQEKTIENLNPEDVSEFIKTRSKKIVNWIVSHPAIKWSIICKNAGIDKGNFQRILKSKNPSIKIDNILKLETELKKYGY